MSRRSLRLHDGLLDRSLPRSSTSFSVGGTSWRNTRSLKLSSSCSESLLNNPQKPSAQSLLNSSVHSEASDASLLSSLLDDSSVQESTLINSFWGLDHDIDPKESTVIAEQSTVLADRTLIGSDSCCPMVQTLSRMAYCKDCDLDSDRKESTCCSSTSCVMGWGPRESRDPETSIYCRDRNCKTRPGILQLWLDICVLSVRRATVCCMSALTHTWQVCRGLASNLPQVNRQTDGTHRAPSSHCGVMESTTNQKELHPNGSLSEHAAALSTPAGGDRKETRRSEPLASPTGSSLASCLLGLMWSTAVLAASCLFRLTLSAASAVWPLTRKICWASWRAGRCAGKRTGDVCRWLSRRWCHMTTRDLPTRFPLRLLLLLLPLLLLLRPCWFAPAALQVVFPAITDWRMAVSNVPGLSSVYSLMSPNSQSTEGAVEERRDDELIYSGTPPGEEEAVADESARLFRLEQSLTALWERVEARGRRAEQRHEELLQLYAELRQQSGRDESWLRGLLELELRTRLDEDRLQREVQWRREAAAADLPSSPTLPAAVSVGVECHSHDALLAELARLEAAVEDIRRDVKGLSACREGCRRLDTVQQTVSEQVSSQVREEVRTLVYGNQLTVGGGSPGDVLPESLLLWLSQRYVSGADLQVSLVSLELRILQNISQHMEQHRSQEEVREAVLHTTGAAGASMTQEDIHVIVKNALRLFSQDKTGRADYALESGGGSVLSTRCSKTYETKAALLSLFGFPLWYFSQSPRAVIQPDVHPGNCWAFRGSKGFLVIRLSMRIVPTAFSLEHIPKTLAPSGTLLSAPQHFSVYGLADEDEQRGKLLGSYSYDEDGESLQTFAVTCGQEDCDQTFQIIEVQVLSNWGHPEYTCIYRFRVHGTPGDV